MIVFSHFLTKQIAHYLYNVNIFLWSIIMLVYYAKDNESVQYSFIPNHYDMTH